MLNFSELWSPVRLTLELSAIMTVLLLLLPGRVGEIDDARRLRLVSSDVSIVRSPHADTTILNCLPARIVEIDRRENAPQANVILALGHDGQGARISARVTPSRLQRWGWPPAPRHTHRSRAWRSSPRARSIRCEVQS